MLLKMIKLNEDERRIFHLEDEELTVSDFVTLVLTYYEDDEIVARIFKKHVPFNMLIETEIAAQHDLVGENIFISLNGMLHVHRGYIVFLFSLYEKDMLLSGKKNFIRCCNYRTCTFGCEKYDFFFQQRAMILGSDFIDLFHEKTQETVVRVDHGVKPSKVMNEYMALNLFCCSVSLTDDFFTSDNRFFKIISQLPLELQSTLCKITFGLRGTFFNPREVNLMLRKIFK